MVQDLRFLQRLRTLSLIEGCSTLVLFGLAMPLKYLANQAWVVSVVGSLHGGLFVALCLMAIWGVWRIPLSPRLALLCMLGAVLPGGPFVLDRKLASLAHQMSAAPIAA